MIVNDGIHYPLALRNEPQKSIARAAFTEQDFFLFSEFMMKYGVSLTYNHVLAEGWRPENAMELVGTVSMLIARFRAERLYNKEKN